jgi:hypothetical protein
MKSNSKSTFELNGTSGVHVNVTSMPEQWRISHGASDGFQITVEGEKIPVPTDSQFLGDLKKASRRTTK